MRDRIREARSAESGFTLIELLIVIVVLGILAGIVVFGVGTFRHDSQQAACQADVKTVSVASDAWNAKFDAFPTLQNLVDNGYLKAAPASAIVIDGAGVVTGTCPDGPYSL